MKNRHYLEVVVDRLPHLIQQEEHAASLALWAVVDPAVTLDVKVVVGLQEDLSGPLRA